MTTESATKTTTSTWAIDPVHSAGEFAIKHLMVATVRGHFKITEGKIVINETDHTASSVTATIDATSINTREEKRDAHLRSGDFFEAEKYPTITFQSTRVEKVSDTDWKVFGNLTFHGVTKEVQKGRFRMHIRWTASWRNSHPVAQKARATRVGHPPQH